MQNMGKSVMRVAKNSIKGFSDTQTKVRDATSNDPWGPSGTQMAEIATLTFNQGDFVEIIEMLDKRLNDKGKNWRHVFKSLTVLDYILHAGSENVVHYFRENLYIVKTLKEFQYIDEDGKDQGANVRQKAKDITSLLLDEKRMKSQRATRKDMRSRMAGQRPDSRQSRERSNSRPNPPSWSNNADGDLQAAIEASKRSAEEEARRNRADNDLEEAMRLSREEDERRRRELAANGNSDLFDEQKQNALIDMDAPAQQPMATGWASFNPYAAQQQAQMEEYMRQQQLMELQRQQQEQQMMYAQQQQQAMQAQYAQQQAYEEHMRQQQMLYAQQLAQQQQSQPIQPQMTGFGANNPFAAFASSSSSPAPPTPQPVQQASSPAPAPMREPSPPPPTMMQQPQRTGGGGPRFRADGDSKHGDLARMLAGGREDGLDTFGNVGNSRVPVWQQKTGQQGGQQGGGGGMVPQMTGLAKPNPFNTSGGFKAPMQFNQPTGYGQANGNNQQQQQQQQNNDQPFFTI
ncbi:epsin [Sporobolomyces salmoneus]|uniref:epsin n=1 Tax=Sporobolomyces salmoneus TaxID=183962 RepID=UPI003172D98C